MKRPFVIVALPYAAGVVAAEFFPAPYFPPLALALLLAALSVAWARARPVLLALALALAGFGNLAFRTAIVSPQDLRATFGGRIEQVVLRGALVETPYHRVFERDEEESWRTIAQLEVTTLQLPGNDWQPARGRVAVSTPGVLAGNFFAGQTVEITGVLRPPQSPMAPGQFDYCAYLRRLGIHHQLQTAATNDWQLPAPALAPPLADRFGRWAKATLALGLPEEDEPLRLLWAMTLGWKTALTGEVSEPFMRSGTMHVFAISGLHIALIAAILVGLLRVCGMPRGWCGLVVIPLIWFYTGVTGWQASAIRSTIMMTIVIGGWSLRRPGDLLNSLAAAAFIILVAEPRQLFQAGFQLSFFVVLSLALFVPVLDEVRRRGLQPDPLLPDELRPRWQLWSRKALHQITASFTTSLAAWLGSIPLVAYYFHLFTPVSLLANLIVVPLSSLALTANLASLLVGGWLPSLAEIFNHSAWLWMRLMVGISEWAAALPGGCWHIRAPSFLAFALYYGALVSVMAGWLARPRMRVWVGAGLALLAIAWTVQWRRESSVTRLTILPLGGGDAIHFDAPGRRDDLLVDCGDESAVQFLMNPFLRAEGVNRLPRLVLTHGDVRHVGGVELLLRRFPAEEICHSMARFRSPVWRELADKLEKTPGLAKAIRRGDRLGPWTVLHPAAEDQFPQADDNTLVLRGEIHGARVLLLSDLGKPGQSVLMERNPDLRADIVVAGLPAQGEPLANALIEAIQPRLIVITDADYPAAARASRKLRQRLATHNCPVIYTRERGAVTLSFSSDGWRSSVMKEAKGARPAPGGEITPDESP